jgi:hypothetical protein
MAKKEWSEVLGKYDNSTIKEALIFCRDQSKYPPTLPQFAEYCKSVEKRHESFYVKAEEHQCASSEVAEENLKKMYGYLNVRSPY